MKNENEYISDGKRYIKDIKKCSCIEQVGDCYEMLCEIKQQGEHTYIYDRKDSSIRKGSGKKKFYLGASALDKLDREAAAFDEMVGAFYGNDFRHVNFDEIDTEIYYRHSNDRYDYMLDFQAAGRKKVKTGCALKEMILDVSDISVFGFKKNEAADKLHNILQNTNDKNVADNPFYVDAVANNDELMRCKIKLHYHIADERECEYIGKILGKKVLPALSEEYDRVYVVDSHTIQQGLLDDSGYTVFHRPYFSMNGNTHSKWELNPHTKCVGDASNIENESISFKDFLELFDKK